LAKVNAHFGEISFVHTSGGTVWSASLDGTLRTWKLSDILAQHQNVEDQVDAVNEFNITEEEERELAELMGL
jgi:hypothetical protein